MAAERWATIADIYTLTGKTVTDALRSQAVATIELHVGLIEAVERPDVTARDRYWLKLAVCYQAAWLAPSPDAFERIAVTQAGQDGESASFAPDAHTLAPFARKAIKRLSWRGGRTIALGNVAPTRVDANSEAYDDRLPWVGV